MTRKLMVLVVAAVLASAGSALAGSREWYTHGTQCQPGHGAYGSAAYGEPGIGNFGNYDTRVFCSHSRDEERPGSFANDRLSYAYVWVQDSSPTNAFGCYGFATEVNGGQWWTAWRYACSQSGGCPDPTYQFTGRTAISWSNPFGPWFFVSAHHTGFSCSIPAVSNGAASWVSSVNSRLQTY